MLSALRSRWDDSDTAAQLRYVGGWVGYGNPAQAYRSLIYLFQGFADLCAQHDIEYWLDWGSLLGYLRHHGGIIPWDYDHDVGMVTKDYEKFIALIERLQAEAAASGEASAAPTASSSASSSSACRNLNPTFCLSDFTFARNGARGYYVMSLASHPEIQIDLVEYITVTETDPATGRDRQMLKHNMDDDTYSGFFYPDYPLEWVFPLRRVDMLGCPTLIPRESDAVTRSHFSAKYMEVLWVPYLLTKMYNPLLTSKLWGPPIREVPVADSYEEGFRLFGKDLPFIVRRPPQFAHITADSLRAFASSTPGGDAECFGYDSAGEVLEGLRVRDVVAQWDKDELQAKILDSPLAGCAQLPQDFVAFDQETDEEKAERETAAAAAAAAAATNPASAATTAAGGVAAMRNAASAGLGLLLTRANSYTFLHLDPPTYGGGWMYLAAGTKSWTFIHPRHIDKLFDAQSNRLRDLPLSELTSRWGHQLHGSMDLLHVTARAGDLTYFPPCWMHRVRTYDKCIGVSGYMKLKQCHAQMAQHTDMLNKKGLNSIWNGNKDI